MKLTSYQIGKICEERFELYCREKHLHFRKIKEGGKIPKGKNFLVREKTPCDYIVCNNLGRLFLVDVKKFKRGKFLTPCFFKKDKSTRQQVEYFMELYEDHCCSDLYFALVDNDIDDIKESISSINIEDVKKLLNEKKNPFRPIWGTL